MTEHQRQLARHALGLPNKQNANCRNHFCTKAGCTDFEEWESMLAEGVAVVGRARAGSSDYDVYWMTARGAMLCLEGKEQLSNRGTIWQ